MGLCVNCIYHSAEGRDVVKKVHGECVTMHITHLCTHPDNITTNFVTGEKNFDSCYKWNYFEECPYFNNGQEDPVIDDPTGDDTDPIEPDVTDPPTSGDDTNNDGDGSQEP